MTQQQHDPKLVEALASALRAALPDAPFLVGLKMSVVLANAVFDALNAEGYWVAPWAMTDTMHGAYNRVYHSSAGATWAALRNAYLAEKGDQDV